MRRKLRNAAKKCGSIVLALCLLLGALPTALGSALQPGELVMMISPDGPTFPLLESAASSETSIIGTYNNGVVGHFMSVDGGMAQVSIGGEGDAGGVIGYVEEEYVSYAVRGMPVAASLPVAETLEAGEDDAERPPVLSPDNLKQLDLPAGIQVEVLGELVSFYQVQYGGMVAYVPKDEIQFIDKQAMYGFGMNREGFAIAKIPEGIENWLGGWHGILPVYWVPDETGFVYEVFFPDGAPNMNMFVFNGETLSLHNIVGEWAQVRSGRAGDGFIKMEYLKLYPFEDMVVASPEAYAAGTYTVGTDLEPGLYTLDVPAGGFGGMEGMSRETDRYHNYYANDAATFAMYLTAPMDIEIFDQAVLSPMDIEKQTVADVGWQYSGNGRFFCGVQLTSYRGVTYEIRLLPGEAIGYTVQDDLRQETGEARRYSRQFLIPGQTKSITMTAGEFLELHNCEIVAVRVENR